MSIFAITGNRPRVRAQRERLRRMDALERGLRKEMRTILNGQYNRAAKLVAAGVTDVETVVEDGGPDVRAALQRHYKRVGSTFGEGAIREFENTFGGKGVGAARGLKGMAEEFWTGFDGWVQAHMVRKVSGVGHTTQRLLRRMISSSIEDGDSYGETAKRIRRARPKINRTRSRRIARTETHGASNAATDHAVNSTRVRMKREWVATVDERVRSPHLSANGQRREQGVPFDVDGEKLMYPGDPVGSPENIINCRCVVLYHPVQDKSTAGCGVWKKGGRA